MTTPFGAVGDDTPASRSVLQTVVDHAPVAFVLLDGEARCRYTNEEFDRLTGASPAEHLGHRLDTVWAELGTSWEEAFRDALGGDSVEAELATGGSPRRLFATRWYPVRVDKDEPTGRVGLFALEITERAQAERALARSVADMEALQALSVSLTAARRPADVAEAVEAWCADVLERIWVKIALVDREARELRFLGGERRPDETRAIPLAEGHPAGDAALANETILIASQDEMGTRYPELAPAGEPGPIAAIPLVDSDGAPVGVLIARAGEGTFRSRERGLLGALGASAGQALARSRSDEATRAIARVLQESLAPPSLDPPSWCEVGLRFEAMGAGVEVGGDFYDLFEHDGVWYLLVGDVCGKGPRAAVLAAAVRQQARWLARSVDGPAELLARLNTELIAHTEEDHRFVTAACAALGRDDEGALALVARAGHPHPLVHRQDGTSESLETMGTLLGVEPDVQIEQESLRLGAGDALILFTDGLTEARNAGDEEFGEAGIRAALAATQADSAGALVNSVVAAALSFVGRPLADDLAVVAAMIPAAASSGAAPSP